MEKIPVINDQVQYVTQPVDKEPVIPADPVKDHGLQLSKNMKLRMRHVDFVENPIVVSDEWKFVNGESVPPAGRENVPYTKNSTKKYASYGDIQTVDVKPYGDSDPANEVCSTIVVTPPVEASENDDTDFVEAVPAMAVDQQQFRKIKTEGRRGEVLDDPITNENYLDRPGVEIKTSETYLATLENEVVSEASSVESESTVVNETSESESTVVNETTESESDVQVESVTESESGMGEG